ncbi:hypothetical protein EJD97_000700 [Solanum chilense]|uniref:Uncharacterized protein n=1 Tax=Solanum chilense TaxID=4083 RepID=A0A6N2CJV4_SOLCI|nr:hypothetical protein EJD97_000700 [Solanum chilense]
MTELARLDYNKEIGFCCFHDNIHRRNICCTRAHLLFEDCPKYRHSWLLLVATLPKQVTLKVPLISK